MIAQLSVGGNGGSQLRGPAENPLGRSKLENVAESLRCKADAVRVEAACIKHAIETRTRITLQMGFSATLLCCLLLLGFFNRRFGAQPRHQEAGTRQQDADTDQKPSLPRKARREGIEKLERDHPGVRILGHGR